jgi:AraC-like DNA-binding protein
MLEAGLSNLESDLNHIEALAWSAYIDPKFKRLSYLKGSLHIVDYYYLIPMVDDFRRYFITAEMAADCGIVFDSGIILTSKRLYFSGEDFYPPFFRQDGVHDFSLWIGELKQAGPLSSFLPQSAYVTAEGSYEGITFFLNLPGNQTSFFFSTLKKDYILSRLATDEVLRKGRILIHDPYGGLLIDSNLEEAGPVQKDSVSITMTGKRRGLMARADIPEEVLRERLAPFKRFSLGFALVYIAAAAALSIFFAYRNARPIRAILQDIRSFGGAPPEIPGPEDFKNDYNYIHHFLSKAGEDYGAFKNKLSRLEELHRENLLERLLYGLIYSEEAYGIVREYFPNFPGTFRIAAVALPRMEEMALQVHAVRQAMIQDIIEPFLPKNCIVHFSDNLLVLFLPGDDKERILECLASINGNLENRLKTSCVIVLGGTVKDLRETHREFYLVRHLLRLKGNQKSGEILQKENMAPHSFPIELLDASRLYEFLLLGEEEKAVSFINNMLYDLYSRFLADENDIQQLFFLYRRILLQISGDLELDMGEEEIPGYDSRQEVSFLFASIAESMRKICGRVNARHAERNRDFEQSVIAFINENITTTGLYIKMITLRFHISENHLQSIARRWTGKSFLEYVESKRMALSRELLLKTSKPISEITRASGYSSENSFYKAFKRFYGMSPSEIRKYP